MEYVCVKKCFFRGRVWAQGETLVPSPGEAVPKHFVKKADHKPGAPVDQKAQERAEAAKALKAVGHGEQAAGAAPVVPGPKNAEGQTLASADFLA